MPNGDSIVTCKKLGSGLDLKNIFIGANANNGIVAEATLKVFPLPQK